ERTPPENKATAKREQFRDTWFPGGLSFWRGLAVSRSGVHIQRRPMRLGGLSTKLRNLCKPLLFTVRLFSALRLVILSGRRRASVRFSAEIPPAGPVT